MVFVRSQKNYFRFAAQQTILFTENFVRDKLLRHYFFLTKTSFFRHKALSKYFFLPTSETEMFSRSNLLTKKPHTIPPPFKLNGHSLSRRESKYMEQMIDSGTLPPSVDIHQKSCNCYF